MPAEPTSLSCQVCTRCAAELQAAGMKWTSCSEHRVVHSGFARGGCHLLLTFHFCSLSKPFRAPCVVCRILHAGLNGEISRGAVFPYAQSGEVICIQAVFFFLILQSHQRIILRKQQVIFHIDVVFGRRRGYFPSLSFYNSLLSCLGGEGQLFIQHA